MLLSITNDCNRYVIWWKQTGNIPYIRGLLERFADKFDFERTIRMIQAKLIRFKLDVISN